MVSILALFIFIKNVTMTNYKIKTKDIECIVSCYIYHLCTKTFGVQDCTYYVVQQI
jgi:hypothetical protein